MVQIIVAVYKKSQTDFKPFVGVFKNGLENKPEAVHPLSLDRKDNNAEEGVAGAINAMLSGFLKNQNYEIHFFDDTKVLSIEGKKQVIFIKPGVYFSFDILLDKIEL